MNVDTTSEANSAHLFASAITLIGEVMEEQVEIPSKSLFKMEEICTITGVKPYVLRFWEVEFDGIKPIISSTGQKLYERKDVEAILLIKGLLYDQKLTIEKAKMKFTELHESYLQKKLQKASASISTSFVATPSAAAAAANREGASMAAALAGVMKSNDFSTENLEKLALAKSKISDLLSMTDSYIRRQ